MRMNLSNLTREEKLKLLEALEEKERRQKETLSSYEPNDGQKQVHASGKKIRLVVSGNGAGKTTLGVHEAMWAALGYNPISHSYVAVPRRVVVVLDKPEKVADKWIPEIRKWFDLSKASLNKNGKPYVNQIMLPNGSEVRFFFHEMDELSFESMEVDDCIFDEPPPRKIYIALLRGMRNVDRQARVLIIGTPITGSWLRKEIYEPWSEGELDDTDCFRFATSVNERNLPPGYVEWFGSKLNEKEKSIRIEGQFFDLDGLALAHLLDRNKHLLRKDKYEWNDRYSCVLIIDPHPRKPLAALLLGADEHGPVALKEIKLKMAPREFARFLKKWYKGYRVVDIVVDSLGSSDMTGGEGFKSFIQVLNEEGIRARATTYADKSDEDWIARIQDALYVDKNDPTAVPKLRILEECRGLINDIETVEWVRYRNADEFKPTLGIDNKDLLACLKYGLATNINKDKGKDRSYHMTQKAYGLDMAKRSKQVIRARLKRAGKL